MEVRIVSQNMITLHFAFRISMKYWTLAINKKSVQYIIGYDRLIELNVSIEANNICMYTLCAFSTWKYETWGPRTGPLSKNEKQSHSLLKNDKTVINMQWELWQAYIWHITSKWSETYRLWNLILRFVYHPVILCINFTICKISFPLHAITGFSELSTWHFWALFE